MVCFLIQYSPCPTKLSSFYSYEIVDHVCCLRTRFQRAMQKAICIKQIIKRELILIEVSWINQKTNYEQSLRIIVQLYIQSYQSNPFFVSPRLSLTTANPKSGFGLHMGLALDTCIHPVSGYDVWWIDSVKMDRLLTCYHYHYHYYTNLILRCSSPVFSLNGFDWIFMYICYCCRFFVITVVTHGWRW